MCVRALFGQDVNSPLFQLLMVVLWFRRYILEQDMAIPSSESSWIRSSKRCAHFAFVCQNGPADDGLVVKAFLLHIIEVDLLGRTA